MIREVSVVPVRYEMKHYLLAFTSSILVTFDAIFRIKTQL